MVASFLTSCEVRVFPPQGGGYGGGYGGGGGCRPQPYYGQQQQRRVACSPYGGQRQQRPYYGSSGNPIRMAGYAAFSDQNPGGYIGPY